MQWQRRQLFFARLLPPRNPVFLEPFQICDNVNNAKRYVLMFEAGEVLEEMGEILLERKRSPILD